MMTETIAKAPTPSGATGSAGASPTDRSTATHGTSVAVDGDAAERPTDGIGETPRSAMPPTAAGNRKRVFTFQKRWLHTLPIMEKVLPDTELDAASVVALRAANLMGDDGKPVDSRDVIVCMLCDDPNSSRESLKLWSRLNCRRGRIENHLMSKHPEFMLLLKQKRDAEGDLAVQIFLQNMREGRCNVRNEISAGLYSHMQAGSSTELSATGHKRAFGHDEFMMPTTRVTAASAGSASSNTSATPVVKHALGPLDAVSDDAESRRKRVKANGETVATATTETESTSDLLGLSLLSYQGPSAFSRWKNLLSSKMVVVTGGEVAAIARVATNLWLIGANVLVTFNEQGPMEAFAASYLTQFHTASEMEPPRGVMLPLFCSLQSRAEAEEWSRSIAAKFGQVDYLISFVHTDRENSPSPASSDRLKPENASRCQDLCEAFSGACMQRSNRSAIVNITAQNENGQASTTTAAVETLTKALSAKLETSNVQVNAIVLQDSDGLATGDEDVELLHLILFLTSPASASVSGSVLRHRRNRSVPATDDHSAMGTVVSSTAGSHGSTATTTPHASDAATSNGVELSEQLI